jgi:hypothetical protein
LRYFYPKIIREKSGKDEELCNNILQIALFDFYILILKMFKKININLEMIFIMLYHSHAGSWAAAIFNIEESPGFTER